MIKKFAVITYHKTGTFLVLRVLEEFSRKNNFYLIRNLDVEKEYRLKEREIFFDTTGLLSLENSKDVIGFRVVRNPRDIIISAARYHSMSIEHRSEPWLYEKNEKDISYNQEIRSFKNFEDQMSFEMNNYSKNEIEKIINFVSDKIITVKYEDLVSNNEKVFYRISKLLEFNKKELDDFAMAFRNHHYSNHIKNNIHINNGRPDQYLGIWNRNLEDQLYGIFGEKLRIFEKIYGYDNYIGDK